MEDLRKRCEFDNVTVRVQACQKLLERVAGVWEKADKDAKAAPETPELKLFWEKCADTNVVVSRTCCSGVFSLVKNGQADFDVILQKLLNLVPTAKGLTGICATVCDLLVLHVVALTEKEGHYTCPYGIRNASHPLVTMVISRPDAWCLILQNLERLYTLTDQKVLENLFEMLAPFYKFILLEPPQSPQFLPLRMALVPHILQIAQSLPQTMADQVKWQTLCLLRCSQLRTARNVSELSHHVTCLLHSYLGVKEATSDLKKQTTQVLAALAVDLCRTAQELGLDSVQILSLVLRLAEDIPESLHTEEIFIHLVSLLEKSTVSDAKPILKLVNLWLKRNGKKNPMLDHMVVLPVLQMVSMPNVSREPTTTQQGLANSILKMLSEDTNPSKADFPAKTEEEGLCSNLTPDGVAYTSFAVLAKSFSGSAQRTSDWLDNLQSILSFHSEIPYNSLCLISAIFVMSEDKQVIEKVLEVLTKIAMQDESKSPSLLPLLLYKLNKLTDPDIKLLVLQAIPSTVSHKVAVAPVLRTLQILTGNTKLKAVSMTLILSLWKRQDRCFPYLQQLIVDSPTSTGGGYAKADQVMVARSTCIRDVCKLKPHQHGSDVLAPLSDILNRCLSDAESVVSALALEGLYYLCEAEVLDIQTAWSVLSDKMGREKRPLVISHVCNLLSLVPELEADGEEYETFTQEVLQLLWGYIQSQDATVAGAAYRALAKYSRGQFHLGYLPLEIINDVREAAVRAAEAEGTDLSQVAAPDVPGYCYTRLLRRVQSDVMQDYEVFLTALVNEEVASIPRGVHHTANRKKSSLANQNKAISAIPPFLQAEFERNKIPGLRPSLAVGVLHSYEPAVSTGRDGKPRQHQVVQLGRGYHQMLYTLLQECPVQLGDWHQGMALPQAWLAYMDRCFNAYSEGHRVELAQQLDRGQAQDPEENERQQKIAFLWARDKIMDLLVSASSGSPSVQANTLLALGGLVVTLTKYYNSLDEETQQFADGAGEHLSYTHWINVVIDTLMCILDHKVLTDNKLLSICNLRTGQERSPCSILAQCGAGLALSMIIPVIMSCKTDAVCPILDSLASRIPGDEAGQTDTQPVLGFFMPLSLGMVLARLFEEHFVETGGNKGMIAVWKALDILEKRCKSEHSNRLGCYLGLSVCLVSMCTDNKADTRVHVCTMQEQLSEALQATSVNDAAFEGICLCLAAVTGTCYTANILPQDTVDHVVAELYRVHCQQPQMPGVSLALGVISQLLWQSDHPTIGDLTLKLYGSWIAGLEQSELPTLQRLSFLKGVMAQCGSEKFMFSITEDSGSSKSGVNLGEVAKVTQQLVRGRHDLALQSTCAWQLGQLCMSAVSEGQSRLCVPMTYHYLPETSIIRAMVDVLLEAGKHGDNGLNEAQLVAILRSLTNGPSQPLPPLNWAGVLSPVIRMVYGVGVEQWSLELAAGQSLVSANAGLLLSSWLLSPLWGTLRAESQLAMFRNLPKLIKSVPVAKLKEFFETGFITPFLKLSSPDHDSDPACLAECQTALEGLLKALQVPDPPHMVSMLLYQIVGAVYSHMPNNKNVPLYTTLCQCLGELPDDMVDNITSQDFEHLDLYPKSLFIRCYLVSNGNQPLAWVNKAVDAHMCKTESDSAECLRVLVSCFHGVYHSKAETCGAPKCHVWLLELMGHIKNIATKVIPTEGLEIAHVVEFLLLVLSAALSSWSGLAVTDLIMAPGRLSPQAGTPHGWTGVTSKTEITSLLRKTLPLTLEALLRKEPWKQSTAKVIDWLISLYKTAPIQEVPMLRNLFKDCLYALRHTAEFGKMTVWSKAFSIL